MDKIKIGEFKGFNLVVCKPEQLKENEILVTGELNQVYTFSRRIKNSIVELGVIAMTPEQEEVEKDDVPATDD